MKNFVKLMLPIGAFLLASAAAVTTTEVTSGTETAAIEGWRRVSMNNCIIPVSCNNIPSTICMSGAFPAYGKVGLDCIQPLYHTP